MNMTILVLLSMAALSLAALIVTSIKHNRRRKRMHRFLQEFNRICTQCKLSLSSQLVLDEAILGLDGQQRKLLFLKRREGAKAIAKMIDLTEVKNCLLEKHYANFPSAEKGRRREKRLQRITLHLVRGDDSTEEINFYNEKENGIKQLVSLANKARHWETMLAKLLEPRRKIA